MGNTVVIAEKPSVARDIARVLGCKKNGNGFISGDNDYIVTWAVGHLAVLFEPEDYDQKFKKWYFRDLPIIPDKMNIKPAKATEEQFNIIKSLINSPKTDLLICATDSGREGELIFRYIYELAKCKKPFKRLWISSMTDEAIKNGFANLKDGKDYDKLYESAKCRSEADWLVGINASRAFSVMYNTNLSIGRVQSPTLGIIVDRQKEIDSFDVKTYYEVQAIYKNFLGVWFREVDGVRDTKIILKDEADKIVSTVSKKDGIVSLIESEEKQVPPPLLYDLTELQRDANKKYGFSAEKTLNIVQDLYEKRKAVTYPRTDSRYLSDDMIKVIPIILKRINFEPYSKFLNYVFSLDKLPITKRIVDNSKITDHHAIIPTNSNINTTNFSKEEKQVFDLIARRFISVFYPYNIYTITRIIVTCEGENFISKGKTIKQVGWTALYEGQDNSDSKSKTKKGKKNQSDDEDQILPDLSKGDIIHIKEAKAIDKKTKPPSQYTEASLLSAMEHAGRFVENEELKEKLKEGGLGTPATRAGIIERLISVGYMKRSGKSIIPTDKGKKLMLIIPPELRSPETTGKWEKGLESIYKGNMQPERFMQSIIKFVNFLVKEAELLAMKDKDTQDFIFENMKKNMPEKALGVCPICKKGYIFENSKAFYCSKWQQGCKFTVWKNSLAKSGIPELTADMMKDLLNSSSIELKEGTITYKTSEGIRFVKNS